MSAARRLPARAGRALVGVVISAVALLVALSGVDLAHTADIVTSANPWWLLAMVACSGLDVSLRGWRWQRLVAPIRRVPYSRMLGYTLVGYLANNVLPARLGELVRSHYLGDREGISRTTALGTVVVERVIDTVAVVVIAALAIVLLGVGGILGGAVVVGLGVGCLLVAGLIVALMAHRLPGRQRLMTVLARWPRLISLAARLRDGLAVAGHPGTLAQAGVLTLCAWSASVAAFAAGGRALGVELTLEEAALLAAGVALATAIPSGPGYLGTFELAAVKLAAAFGTGASSAFAVALVIHAGILLVTSGGGAVAFARLGSSGWRSAAREAAPNATARPEALGPGSDR